MQILLIRKGYAINDRAGAALANLQRSASAIGMLRSRIESRVNPGACTPDPGLDRVLELVKSAELLLREMSFKAESARYLDEFIKIMSGARENIGGIEGDILELVPRAESALSEMNDVISNILQSMSPAVDPAIIERASAQAELLSQQTTEKAQSKGVVMQADLERVAV